MRWQAPGPTVAVVNKTTAAAAAGNPVNEACPSQRYQTACTPSELFEHRRRRMDDRAAVSSPVHAKFHSFQPPSSLRQARQQSAIYLTPIHNPQSHRFRHLFPICSSKRRAC